jgi:hypothetical protein
MSTKRMFFGLLLTMLGIFAIVDGMTDAPMPDLWEVFGICSLIAMGVALLTTRPE